MTHAGVVTSFNPAARKIFELPRGTIGGIDEEEGEDGMTVDEEEEFGGGPQSQLAFRDLSSSVDGTRKKKRLGESPVHSWIHCDNYSDL